MSDPASRVIVVDGQRLEFEAGYLVKVDGQRPDYMDGYRLIKLVRSLAASILGMTEETKA